MGIKILPPPLKLTYSQSHRPAVVYAECMLPWPELPIEIYAFYIHQDYVLQVPMTILATPPKHVQKRIF